MPAGGRYMRNGFWLLLGIGRVVMGCCGGTVSPGALLVESQNLLCLERDVTVENDWLHLTHLICMRQSACIRL